MAGEPHRSIALAVTGASGALYAVRTLAELLSRGVHVELVVSDYGRRLLRDELGVALVAALLVYEQSLVSADDLSQVKRAFDMNGYVGILYLIVLAVAVYGG